MAACDRPQCPELLYDSTNIQNGNGRDYQKLPDKRRMASFDRSERCVLSRAHTSRFSTFATLPCRQENVPIQSSAIRVSNGTPRVHADCKRGKAHSSVPRNSSSPIPGRLVVKGKHQTPVPAPDKRTPPYSSTTQLRDKFRKIRARAYTKNRFPWLPFRSATRKSLSNRKETKNSAKIDSGHGGLISNYPKVANVPDRGASIPGKDYTNGSATHVSSSMVSQNKLVISPVHRSEDSSFKSLVKTSSVVERSKQCESRMSLTSRRSQHHYLYRCVKPGLGSPSRKHDRQWQLDKSREISSYQCPRVKGSLSGLKKNFQNTIQNQRILIATDNATVVSYLNKQGGTHSWDMCLLVWRILAYCNPRNILIRARHIQGCLNVIADSLSRWDKIIQTEWSLHPQIFTLICKVWHTPMVDMFATKMNHKLPLYVSPVPDANALNIDALNISWEGLDGYVYCPVALIPKVIQKMNTYRCKMIVVAPGWPMMHWFWDLVNLSTKPPLQLPHWPHLLKQPFSHKYHQNLLYLNLHV